MEFEDIEGFMSALNKAIEMALRSVVDEEVKRLVVEVIQEEVYDTYIPNHYERRHSSGGFADEGNLKVEFNSSGDGVNVDITNETRGNGDARGKYIDTIIESGSGYKWNGKPPARPFAEIAEKRIIAEQIVERALVSALKSLGFDVTLE
ncbi:MAG: hypothetical protein ACRCX8_18990 [Sarcina sp.]